MAELGNWKPCPAVVGYCIVGRGMIDGQTFVSYLHNPRGSPCDPKNTLSCIAHSMCVHGTCSCRQATVTNLHLQVTGLPSVQRSEFSEKH